MAAAVARRVGSLALRPSPVGFSPRTTQASSRFGLSRSLSSLPNGDVKSSELLQKISNAVNEAPEATVKGVRSLLEEYIRTSKLSPAEVDIAKIGVLTQQISKIAKDSPPEAAVVLVRPLVTELSKMVIPQVEEAASVKTLEGRICYLEASQKNSEKYNFILNGAIVCVLMAVPGVILKVQFDVDNHKASSSTTAENIEKKIEGLDSRMCAMEKLPASLPNPEAATEMAPAQEARAAAASTSPTPEAATEKAPTQEAKLGWFTWAGSKMGFK